jgi:shikimate dehydrogenase
MVDRTLSTYCIIGDPIDHSLSPALHNASFKTLNLKCTYIAFRVAKGDLYSAICSLRSVNISGFNVTIPHKVEILKYVDVKDNTAESASAVNTVKNENGKLLAYNTDIKGFITPLRNRNVKFDGMNILLLGAGGAARAIVTALAEEKGISKIYIFSRNQVKMKELVIIANQKGLQCVTIEQNEIPNFSISSNLIINATPIGTAEEASPISYKYIPKASIVYDIIYNPINTGLILSAKRANAEIVYGYEMLLEQAAESFKIWTGVRPPITPMKKILFGGFGEPA